MIGIDPATLRRALNGFDDPGSSVPAGEKIQATVRAKNGPSGGRGRVFRGTETLLAIAAGWRGRTHSVISTFRRSETGPHANPVCISAPFGTGEAVSSPSVDAEKPGSLAAPVAPGSATGFQIWSVNRAVSFRRSSLSSSSLRRKSSRSSRNIIFSRLNPSISIKAAAFSGSFAGVRVCSDERSSVERR